MEPIEIIDLYKQKTEILKDLLLKSERIDKAHNDYLNFYAEFMKNIDLSSKTFDLSTFLSFLKTFLHKDRLRIKTCSINMSVDDSNDKYETVFNYVLQNGLVLEIYDENNTVYELPIYFSDLDNMRQCVDCDIVKFAGNKKYYLNVNINSNLKVYTNAEMLFSQSRVGKSIRKSLDSSIFTEFSQYLEFKRQLNGFDKISLEFQERIRDVEHTLSFFEKSFAIKNSLVVQDLVYKIAIKENVGVEDLEIDVYFDDNEFNSLVLPKKEFLLGLKKLGLNKKLRDGNHVLRIVIYNKNNINYEYIFTIKMFDLYNALCNNGNRFIQYIQFVGQSDKCYEFRFTNIKNLIISPSLECYLGDSKEALLLNEKLNNDLSMVRKRSKKDE